jgi:predicted lipoprotein with Yx(FWY)xxD motif
MKRLITVIGATALVLAACGDDDNASENVSTADGGTASAPTVTVVEVEGLGSVLADADGMVLYFNDQEAADQSILCEDACVDEWPPLEAGSASPTGESGVTGLDVADRPDGTSQVTYNGHRLYTFVDDESPGTATGDGDSDEFNGQQFTWHAATVDMAGASGATTPSGTQPSDTTSSTGTGY